MRLNIIFRPKIISDYVQLYYDCGEKTPID